MWINAELVLSAYKPLKLEKGMKFIKWNTKNINGQFELYELDYNVRDNSCESFMTKFGHPVELSLYEWNPANPQFNQLATPNEIGWIDEGEDSDELREITIDDVNSILRTHHRCQVQCIDNHSEGMNVPIFDEEKVTIRLIESEEEE